MNVLIMGGTRFNGLHLVWELVRQGHQVTTFNRGVTQAELPPEVRRLYGDRKDHEQLRAVLGGRSFDAILDISAYVLEDVSSMLDLFQGHTGHYIFASSTVVFASTDTYPITEEHPLDPDPNASDYSKNKMRCEAYLNQAYAEQGFPCSIARFAMVYGPHNFIPQREQLMLLRLVRRRKVLIPGNGMTLIHLGHVDDEARALAKMMGNPRTLGQTYIITGPQAITDLGYVSTMARVMDLEPEIIYLLEAAIDELPPEQRRPLIQRLGKPNAHWAENNIYSVQKMVEHLDFQHQYEFEAGIRQTYYWFLAEGLDKTMEYDFTFEDALIERYG